LVESNEMKSEKSHAINISALDMDMEERNSTLPQSTDEVTFSGSGSKLRAFTLGMGQQDQITNTPSTRPNRPMQRLVDGINNSINCDERNDLIDAIQSIARRAGFQGPYPSNRVSVEMFEAIGRKNLH
jgi:hypothetical protein